MTTFPEYRSWLVVEIAAPFGAAVVAGKLFADLGCTVARISLDDDDNPEPELVRQVFELFSRSKHSVGIDWDRPEVARVLEAVLNAAEVLVVDGEGLQRVRSAFDADDLQQRFPGLTICACTPFGLAGPMANWAGDEAIVQAASGIMSITGHPGSPPTRIAGTPLTVAAAMFSVTSSLADVMRKRMGGRAGFLDVAVYDTALAFESASLPALFLSGSAPKAIGNRHSMSVPWNSFPCSDGWVIICAGNHPNWVRLCETMNRPDLSANPRYATQDDRIACVDEIEAEIVRWTQRHSVSQVVKMLNENNIAGGSVFSLQEVLDHPQFKARNLAEARSEGRQAGGAFHVDRSPLQTDERRWSPGAGTRTVLLERDLVGGATYDDWLARGIIFQAEEVSDAEPA